MAYNLRNKTKKKFTPRPAVSASTKELAKELGLPWLEPGKAHASEDLPCAHCKKVKRTKLCRVGVSVQVPSGIERLCEGCQNED